MGDGNDEAARFRAGRRPDAPELVPRFQEQGYAAEEIAARRAWVEAKTGVALDHVGRFSLAAESLRGNVENPIGAVQVPLGLAGPLLLAGADATGAVYVPLATTEGALVRSYERGMVALTRAGGARVEIFEDENRVSPVFDFPDVERAATFARELPGHLPALREAAATTTRHGRLLEVICHPVGRHVFVELGFATGDAHGMNMIVKASDAACRWIAANLAGASSWQILSGHSSEKRASGKLLAGGKGKRVVAGAILPRRTVRAVLHATPEAMLGMWQKTVLGQMQAGVIGYNGHFANGLTAVFLACGQDVANVANSAVGITSFELTAAGDLAASVTLPSLTVATVGGGTGLATAAECLSLLGCVGTGKARRLAAIVAGTLLAGELSMGAALASGEFVAAHEAYGRNRPAAPG